jgi:hypothetical protein
MHNPEIADQESCKHTKVLVSDNILACCFFATCLRCGKTTGGHSTIKKAKAALKK